MALMSASFNGVCVAYGIILSTASTIALSPPKADSVSIARLNASIQAFKTHFALASLTLSLVKASGTAGPNAKHISSIIRISSPMFARCFRRACFTCVLKYSET